MRPACLLDDSCSRAAVMAGWRLQPAVWRWPALTTISQQQAGPQSLVLIKTYFDANPQASKDMTQLEQPLVTMSTKCRLPLTLPQLMGLMQGAQSQAGSTLPGVSPGAPQAAQTVGTPGTASPGQPSPASAVTQSQGALPGPPATTTR
ncbi:MAG: heme-binding protein [Mycobacterium sp.]|jgi:hypothetical protein|nr:heme-binding protein [Mycobacterium sp.]